MGKSKRTDREFGREKRLSHENKKLKKEIAQLRKLLARVDLDRYSQVKDIIQEHYQEEKEQEGQDILDRLKQEWKCYKCSNGYLEITLYTRRDGTYYYRKCYECDNRTKSQRYDAQNVKGILRNSK